MPAPLPRHPSGNAAAAPVSVKVTSSLVTVLSPKATQLLGQLNALSTDATLCASKVRLNKALQPVFDAAGREFKLEIYREIGRKAGKAEKDAEAYGRDHFADSIVVIRQLVQQKAAQI